MGILLDSAVPEEAREAMALGFVWGITTNPTLLARVKDSVEGIVRTLCGICPGLVFYQLAAADLSGRTSEGHRAIELDRELHESSPSGAGATAEVGHIGLKIAASTENMALVRMFSTMGVPVAVTAIFSLSQVYLACEAGARYVVPYVNRTTRLRGDGIGFVRDMAAVCRATGRGTEVLAASVKSPDETVQTLLAGATHISMPLSVLQSLGDDPLSREAVAEFAANGVRW